MPACPLCEPESYLLWRGDSLRVVLADEPAYPGFCRVIWNHHVAEMTDLSPNDRRVLMDAVWATEAALREIVSPDKINLASLGNQVPHLHWHVIPRFRDDRTFPDAIWAPPRRPQTTHPLDIDALRRALSARLDARAAIPRT